MSKIYIEMTEGEYLNYIKLNTEKNTNVNLKSVLEFIVKNSENLLKECYERVDEDTIREIRQFKSGRQSWVDGSGKVDPIILKVDNMEVEISKITVR